MYTGGVSKYMMDRRQLDDTFGESCRHAGLATTYWPEFDHTLMSPADRDRVLSSVGDWCEQFKVPAATSRLRAKSCDEFRRQVHRAECRARPRVSEGLVRSDGRRGGKEGVGTFREG